MEIKKVFFALFMAGAIGLSAQTNSTQSPGNAEVVPIPGSSSGWDSTSNAQSSDDSYVSNSENLEDNGDFSDYTVYTDFGFNIPESATITGIEVTVERVDQNAKAKDKNVRLVKEGVIENTNKASTASWSSGDLAVGYGSSSDLWGQTWTPAEINSTSFGFAFSIFRSGGGAQVVIAGIDNVTLTVHYSTGNLPVVLDQFSGFQKDDQVNLSWSTHNESEMDHFAIKRQYSGGSFMIAGNIDATGGGQSFNEYHFSDKPNQDGQYSYSLYEVGMNGNETLLGNVEVSFTLVSSLSMDILYEQISSGVPKILIQAAEEGEGLLKVTNSSGGVLKDLEIHLNQGDNEIELDSFESAENGIYFVLLEVNGQSSVKKFLFRR